MFHFCLPLQEADEGRLFLYYYECILSHRPIPPSTPQYNCGSRTNHNSTYFVNNGYPSSFNTIGQCSTTIEKVFSHFLKFQSNVQTSPNVCQLRLDFDEMEIQQPDPITHQCTSDRFFTSDRPQDHTAMTMIDPRTYVIIDQPHD